MSGLLTRPTARWPLARTACALNPVAGSSSPTTPQQNARTGAAEGEVNSFLARRFAVPIDLVTFPELGGVLKSITLDRVECRLRVRRPPVPEDARRKADRALDWLKKVADARIDLPAAGELPPSPLRGSLGEVTGEERILTFDELSDH